MNSFTSLNEKLDIKKVVSQYMEVKRNIVKCPFHDDNKPSMSLRTDVNRYKCFACGAKGDAIDFVSKMENITMVEAAQKLAKSIGETFACKVDRVYQKRKEFIDGALEGLQEKHIAYLKGRGIEDSGIKHFSLGGVEKFEVKDEHGNLKYIYKDAIVQPIKENKKMVFYNIRSLDGTVHRIEDGAKKNEWVGNIDEAIKNKGKPVIVTEGYFDCIQAWQEDLVAVCTFGASLSEVQAQKILTHTGNIILALDNDSTGIKASLEYFKLLKKISPATSIRFAVFEEGCKDLGEHLYKNDTVDSISFYEWSKKVDLDYRTLVETIDKHLSPLEKRKNLLLLAKDNDVTLKDIQEEIKYICQ